MRFRVSPGARPGEPVQPVDEAFICVWRCVMRHCTVSNCAKVVEYPPDKCDRWFMTNIWMSWTGVQKKTPPTNHAPSGIRRRRRRVDPG